MKNLIIELYKKIKYESYKKVSFECNSKKLISNAIQKCKIRMQFKIVSFKLHKKH